MRLRLRAGLWGRPRVDEDRPLPTVVDDEYLVLHERMQVEKATRLLSAHSFGKEHCPGVITDGPPITIVPHSTSWSTKASRKSQSGWDWTGPRSQVAPARNLTITRRRRMGASFAAGLPLPTPPPPAPPALVVPGPHEVSFGRLVSVGPGTRRILVSIDERLRAEKAVRGHRFDFAVALPRRDVTLTVSAVDGRGRRASTVVGPVYGLPRTAAPRAPPLAGYGDARLARTIRALARAFPGTCAVFVQDLRDGAGAAWNAQARLPAASTLKVAIAVEVLRVLHGKPALGTRPDRLLRRCS